MTSTAASFVDQINAAYSEVVKAEASALPAAIKCGEFLNLAKENVKAEKKKWGDWLSANCPNIPQTTASLYMRLAQNKAKIKAAKSINGARELLPKAQPRGPKPNDADKPSGGFEPQPDNSSKFEDELEALAPDEVCRMLTDTWDDDHLAQLAKLITDHLQTKKASAAATAIPRPTISNTVTNSPRPLGPALTK